MQDAEFCFVSQDSRRGGHPDGGEAAGVGFDTVYVRTAPQTYRVYEFFHLEKATLRSCFQSTVLLSPDGDFPAEDIVCRVSWTRGGETRTAQTESFTVEQSDFFGRSFSKVASRFSYPFFSQERGGYMACTIRTEDARSILCSVLDYSLPRFTKLYPYTTIETATQMNGLRAQSYSTCEVDEYEAYSVE